MDAFELCKTRCVRDGIDAPWKEASEFLEGSGFGVRWSKGLDMK